MAYPETLPDVAVSGAPGRIAAANTLRTAVGNIDGRLHAVEGPDSGPLNVRTRGVVSSTSLDQSTAIQDADDEAYADGRPLYFPAGTYHYGVGLRARTIVGDGLESTDLVYLDDQKAITSDYDGSTDSNRSYRTLRDFRLRNVAMLGTIPTTRAGIAGSNTEIQAINRAELAAGTGLDLTYEAMTEATNLYIQGFEYGIRSAGSGYAYRGYSTFTNVQTSSSRQGVRLEHATNSFRFTNCRFGRAREQALRIVKGNQNVFHGCCFEGTAFRTTLLGDPTPTIYDDLFTGFGTNWAVYIDTPAAAGENRVNTFIANRFEGNFRNMYLNGGVENTVLVGNFIYPALDAAATGGTSSDPIGSGKTNWITDSGTNTAHYANAWL